MEFIPSYRNVHIAAPAPQIIFVFFVPFVATNLRTLCSSALKIS